jgi:hypothetical protein
MGASVVSKHHGILGPSQVMPRMVLSSYTDLDASEWDIEEHGASYHGKKANRFDFSQVKPCSSAPLSSSDHLVRAS